MKALVLARPILDPEIPPIRFKIDAATNRPLAGIGNNVLGPFERSALELALQLRDKGTVDYVAVLAAGGAECVDLLRSALGFKVDDAVHVDVDGLDPLDPMPTAEVLARAVARMEGIDLVLVGRQAGDWDNGQVGYVLAEKLGRPSVSVVRQLSGDGDKLVGVRETPNGAQRFSLVPPAIVVVGTDKATKLRSARVPDMLAAKRRAITKWSLGDLGLADGLASLRSVDVHGVATAQRESNCELVKADSPADVAKELARHLVRLTA